MSSLVTLYRLVTQSHTATQQVPKDDLLKIITERGLTTTLQTFVLTCVALYASQNKFAGDVPFRKNFLNVLTSNLFSDELHNHVLTVFLTITGSLKAAQEEVDDVTTLINFAKIAITMAIGISSSDSLGPGLTPGAMQRAATINFPVMIAANEDDGPPSYDMLGTDEIAWISLLILLYHGKALPKEVHDQVKDAFVSLSLSDQGMSMCESSVLVKQLLDMLADKPLEGAIPLTFPNLDLPESDRKEQLEVFANSVIFATTRDPMFGVLIDVCQHYLQGALLSHLQQTTPTMVAEVEKEIRSFHKRYQDSVKEKSTNSDSSKKSGWSPFAWLGSTKAKKPTEGGSDQPSATLFEGTPYFIADNVSLKEAVVEWDKNSIAAMEKYGHICLWNTSNVTNMQQLFSGQRFFNDPIGSWDTSNVTDMSEMFSGALAFNRPLNGWNVSKVTTMNDMFKKAFNFNQPLTSWDTSNVTSMCSVFEEAVVFNQPLSNWNVKKVDMMRQMFKSAKAFNQPLNTWQVGNVVNMGNMFESAISFNQPLNSWDVSKVATMIDMFSNASKFNQPLDNWNVKMQL